MKRVFIDMDNVLVDFQSGLDQVSEEVKAEYAGRPDEIPGLFAKMKPMPGAIEAVHELQKHYDLFILSTAPWKNPSAWADKVEWVTKYLNDVFYKKIIITHRKDLCQGDYLIDDRGKNGTSEFIGEWIEFGSEKFPDWESVLQYLYSERLDEYLQEIVNNVADYGYKVDKDWVLTCVLYILEMDIKLSVDNFDKSTSKTIYNEKRHIADSIEAACRLLNRYGILERGLTTKLALLPIVYHIYKHKLFSIVATFKKGQMKSVESGIYVDMRTWLYRAIVTNFFASGTRDKLGKIRAIQHAKSKADYFPISEIIAEVDLNVNDDLIDELMQTEAKNAFPVLNIIYSSTRDVSYLEAKTEYDVDHIHAQAKFGKSSGDNRYNTIANLQLLNFKENRSKNDTSLKEWWDGKSLGEKKSYLLPESFNTDINAFDNFFDGRGRWLRGILVEKLDANESKYAGVYLEEKILGMVYREGHEKYKFSWTIHEDRAMQMPLNDGSLLSIVPNHKYSWPMLELTPLTDEQRKALMAEGLAKESFRESTNKWNNSLIHEGAFGICFDRDEDMQSRAEKVFKALDLLLK